MNGAVLTGDTGPVDLAVCVGVLGDDLVLGVDQTLEPERVGAASAGEDIGVVGGEHGGFTGEDLRGAVLRGDGLAGVRTHHNRVIADAAPDHAIAGAGDDGVVASDLEDVVVAGAAPDGVVAATTDDDVIAGHGGNRTACIARDQEVVAGRAGQMGVLVPSEHGAQFSEETVESCHLLYSLLTFA